MEKKTVMFKMKLLPGFKDEYKKRHDEIWPKLLELLNEAGISDYSIALDEETNILFGCYKASFDNKIQHLPGSQLMKEWWVHMADVMETAPDNVPLSSELTPVFYMK
ncbi:MAG: L-rhamnose mutarotase [Emcibacteraceae bacterium]|nr:L-rhamnose mutarotase [Emcibacteraceae bacterium]